MFLRFLA